MSKLLRSSGAQSTREILYESGLPTMRTIQSAQSPNPLNPRFRQLQKTPSQMTDYVFTARYSDRFLTSPHVRANFPYESTANEVMFAETSSWVSALFQNRTSSNFTG